MTSSVGRLAWNEKIRAGDVFTAATSYDSEEFGLITDQGLSAVTVGPVARIDEDYTDDSDQLININDWLDVGVRRRRLPTEGELAALLADHEQVE